MSMLRPKSTEELMTRDELLEKRERLADSVPPPDWWLVARNAVFTALVHLEQVEVFRGAIRALVNADGAQDAEQQVSKAMDLLVSLVDEGDPSGIGALCPGGKPADTECPRCHEQGESDCLAPRNPKEGPSRYHGHPSPLSDDWVCGFCADGRRGFWFRSNERSVTLRSGREGEFQLTIQEGQTVDRKLIDELVGMAQGIGWSWDHLTCLSESPEPARRGVSTEPPNGFSDEELPKAAPSPEPSPQEEAAPAVSPLEESRRQAEKLSEATEDAVAAGFDPHNILAVRPTLDPEITSPTEWVVPGVQARCMNTNLLGSIEQLDTGCRCKRRHPPPPSIQTGPGSWTCPCGAVNFDLRKRCRFCRGPHGQAVKRVP